MKPRFSPSSDRSCVKMAHRFADLSVSEQFCMFTQSKEQLKYQKSYKSCPERILRISKRKKIDEESLVSWKKKLTTVKTVQIHKIRKCGNPCFRTILKLHLIDKRIQFAIQEEQLYAECAARLKNFHSSGLLCICPSLFETDLNRAKYSLYEKLLTVFSVAGFCFEEKYSHQLQYIKHPFFTCTNIKALVLGNLFMLHHIRTGSLPLGDTDEA